MKSTQLKQLSTLNLVAGIISILLAIPVLGAYVDTFSIVRIALLVLAILVLIRAGKLEQPKNAAILSIVSGILGLIGSVVMFLTVTGTAAAASAASSYATDPELAGAALGGIIGGGLLGSVFAFPAWILLIISAVFFFINYGKSKTAMELAVTEEMQGQQFDGQAQ